METKHEIPQKMGRYLRRLASEYRKRGKPTLADVLEGSKFEVNEETEYDNWNGGMYGHDLLLLVPGDLMGHIPLDDQQGIQSLLREDLNKAASAAQSEYVSGVHFEFLEEQGQNNGNLRTLNGSATGTMSETGIWLPNTIRLFISHRDTWKREAHQLADELLAYGISSFVAHDTIEPDEDWQKEIETALQTMDVMLAFITDDFFESAWTNQEIGFALARGLAVISIKFEKTDPVGFIRNRQAIKGSLKEMPENAAKVFATVEKRLGGTKIYRSSMLARLIDADTFAEAETVFERVSRMQNFSNEELQQLVDAFSSNSQISRCRALTRGDRYLNFLNQHSNQKLEVRRNKIVVAEGEADDEIPF